MFKYLLLVHLGWNGWNPTIKPLLDPILVMHCVSESQKEQNKLFSVSCFRLDALTLLVDHLFYLTSAFIESYIS